MKYNLSKIMKRAWEMVKGFGFTISEGLKKAWKEAKEMKENIVEGLKTNLEEMLYGNYHINAGIVREVRTRRQENGEGKREYLTIACYTMNGKFKRSYKCGYVNLNTNEYVCGKYDDVDARNKEYIGR